MRTRHVLVFPAGTEIGLEIFSALRYCKEVRLFGASQATSNHGPFVYPDYAELPSIHEEGWVEALVDLCHRWSIEYIFPAYDDLIVALAREAHRIPATIISAPAEACEITRSKADTYRRLAGVVRVPALYARADDAPGYPLLVKPDRGQGSFGIRKVNDAAQLQSAVSEVPGALICEYLPGEEYTIDCFSDRDRGLLFARARSRRRVRNGISVNTVSEDLPEVRPIAERIGRELSLHGAWFFQLKRAADGQLALLEVAPRIAGAMATHRVMGVNFPLLSIFEHERLPLGTLVNEGPMELDRALVNRFRHSIRFSALYVDLDDTLIVHGKVNIAVVRLIFQAINDGKPVRLVTRHAYDVAATLMRFRLAGLFDEVIHLQNGEPKSAHILEADALLVDDSFSERREVSRALGIPTLDPSMVEMLIEQSAQLNRTTVE